MVHVEFNQVDVGVIKSPLTDMLTKFGNKDILIKAEITRDLYFLFSVLIKKFGKGDLADMISMALHDATEEIVEDEGEE